MWPVSPSNVLSAERRPGVQREPGPGLANVSEEARVNIRHIWHGDTIYTQLYTLCIIAHGEARCPHRRGHWSHALPLLHASSNFHCELTCECQALFISREVIFLLFGLVRDNGEHSRRAGITWLLRVEGSVPSRWGLGFSQHMRSWRIQYILQWTWIKITQLWKSPVT